MLVSHTCTCMCSEGSCVLLESSVNKYFVTLRVCKKAIVLQAGMRKSAMITKCWMPQINHRDNFSPYTQMYMCLVLLITTCIFRYNVL